MSKIFIPVVAAITVNVTVVQAQPVPHNADKAFATARDTNKTGIPGTFCPTGAFSPAYCSEKHSYWTQLSCVLPGKILLYWKQISATEKLHHKEVQQNGSLCRKIQSRGISPPVLLKPTAPVTLVEYTQPVSAALINQPNSI